MESTALNFGLCCRFFRPKSLLKLFSILKIMLTWPNNILSVRSSSCKDGIFAIHDQCDSACTFYNPAAAAHCRCPRVENKHSLRYWISTSYNIRQIRLTLIRKLNRRSCTSWTCFTTCKPQVGIYPCNSIIHAYELSYSIHISWDSVEGSVNVFSIQEIHVIRQDRRITQYKSRL